MGIAERTPGSQLDEAQANDKERLEAIEDARQEARERARKSDDFEPVAEAWKPPVARFDLVAQLLADILAQLQASANPEDGPVHPIRPRTAQDVIDRETADFDQALIEDSIEWYEPDEYEALAAEGNALADAEELDNGTLRKLAIPRPGMTPTTE